MDKIANKDLIACHYCDSLYEKATLGKREKLVCRTCGSTIHSNNADFRAAFIFAQTALILFIIANTSPFITLDMQGDVNTISIFSSVQALFENGLPLLAFLVMMFVIIVPLWYLLSVLWVVFSFRFNVLHKTTRQFLHWMDWMAPWSMLEVYLIGVIVTMFKIMQMAHISFDSGFWAYCVLMICSVLVNIRFDLSDAIFLAYQDEHDE